MKKKDDIIFVNFNRYGVIKSEHVNLADGTIRETEYPNVDYEDIPSFVAKLEEIDKRLANCLLEMELMYDRYCDNDSNIFAVHGWRPLTEEEKTVVNKYLARQRELEAENKKKVKDQELKEYARLKAKFGDK